MGPLISDVERFMQEKGYDSKREKGLVITSPRKGVRVCKKRSRGKIEGCPNANAHVEGQWRMSGQKKGSPNTKGQKLSSMTSKIIGSGMAKVVMQPHQLQ